MSNMSRFDFLRSLAGGAVSAAAAPKAVVEAVVEAAVGPVAETAAEVVAPLAHALSNSWGEPLSYSELANHMWNCAHYTKEARESVMSALREWADAKGVGFDDLCSRIVTMSDGCWNRPRHWEGLRGGLYRLNGHNDSDLDLLFSKTWDDSMEELHRLGYNVGPRGTSSTGCPKSWFDESDHLKVPRDVEYYKQVRKDSFNYVYDQGLSPQAESVVNSEVFFEDENVFYESSDPRTERRWDDETGEGYDVIVSTALVPMSQVARLVLETPVTYGPNYSFTLIRPQIKFVFGK